MNKKIFKDLCLDITEEQYRELPYYSYSKIAKYARLGVYALTTEEKEVSPAMLFGSVVDTLITDKDNFGEKYYVMEKDQTITDTIRPIIDWLINNRTPEVATVDLERYPKTILERAIEEFNFGGSNWKTETKISKLIEGGKDYYQAWMKCLKYPGCVPISLDLYNEALNLCNKIVAGRWTYPVFRQRTNQEHIEFLFQQKIGVPYSSHTSIALDSSNTSTPYTTNLKGMIDLIIIDHNIKTIKIYDIKTTSSMLREFEESFYKWRYDIQHDVYKYIITEVIKSHEYFKDFTIYDPIFIVASRYEKKVLMYQYNNIKTCEWPILLNQMYWLDTTKNYEYEFEAYKNNGIIQIN